MNSFKFDRATILIISAILFAAPFFIFKLNLLRRDHVYSGKITDALSLTPVDLVEVKAEGKTTYTNKDGKFAVSIGHPIFESIWPQPETVQITVNPTTDFEGRDISVKCGQNNKLPILANYDCPSFVYPTAPSVASRVLVTRIGPGTPTYNEIAARKERLWNLLASESKNVWANKESFIGTLVTNELIEVKFKIQPVSFNVSENVRVLSEYNYFGTKVSGELAAVDVTVNAFSGKAPTETLYFVKRDGLWRYLISESPAAVGAFNSKNSWVINKK